MYNEGQSHVQAAAEARRRGLPTPELPEASVGEAAAGLLSGAFSLGVMCLLWIAASATYQLLISEVGGRPVYVAAGIAIGSTALGWTFYRYRDIRRWRSMAILQIVLAVCVGTVGLLNDSGSLTDRILSILSAIVAIADGINNLSNQKTEILDGTLK